MNTFIFLAIDKADILSKYLRFITVGAFGFGVDVSVTYFLKEYLRLQKYLSNSIGFISGVTFNYTFNRIWTFESTEPQIGVQYIKFLVIGLIGLALVNGIIYLLHGKLKMNFYVAKILAMIVFMFWNFSANYFYTFQG